ncbi:thymus-specific serine protease [Alosa sapidissima]|uniref:thymus-specific serine protease n=1 Tax=Alosa sapidissima TaxID=34773 RepID=UPI001C088982|nr:thymus-specific serine protease [Alosa sapidissima]
MAVLAYVTSSLFKYVLVVVLCLCCSGDARFKGFRRFMDRTEATQHVAKTGPEVEDHWFTQRLDHFNGADTRVWKQRYFINDSFYRPGGPVFLMIGGEGPANPAWMQYGSWLTYAEKLGALCLLLEHRFYGKSHPTEDLSTSNLRFLSSRQALADLAHFRSVVAEERGLASSRWVAFGGSYPGSLAAWLRLKYPHLVHAAIATSAPIHATVNFPEYLEVVWRSLASFSPECPLLVKQASDTLSQMLKNPLTFSNITKDFQLCSPLQLDSFMDSAHFLEALAGNFMDVVQYNEDNRAFEGVVGTNVTIGVLCGAMADASLGSVYERYAGVARLLLHTHSQRCLDPRYTAYLQDMTNTSWSAPGAAGGRQWVYQTCTEFGFYQSTDSPNQPFTGFPLPYHLQQCSDIFNVSVDVVAAVRDTNEQYGGYGLRTSRVAFPNGSIDPWHALGVTQDLSQQLPAIFIKGTAHCANMYPARAEDLPQLALARDHVYLLLQQWLKE